MQQATVEHCTDERVTLCWSHSFCPQNNLLFFLPRSLVHPKERFLFRSYDLTSCNSELKEFLLSACQICSGLENQNQNDCAISGWKFASQIWKWILNRSMASFRETFTHWNKSLRKIAPNTKPDKIICFAHFPVDAIWMKFETNQNNLYN